MTTVLVVDDSAVDRQLAGRLLDKNSDWEILYANDGKEGLSQIESHVPDLVVTDLMMPELNGLELVAAVKSDYPLIPVILMTAGGSEQIAIKALKEGAASYVPKSSLALKLVDTVKRVLAASMKERTNVRLMQRMSNCETVFELENDLDLFPTVVNYLQQVLSSTNAHSEIERLRVGVALEEALLNAYYHGNLEVESELREIDHSEYYDLAKKRSKESPYQDRRIHVQATISAGETRFLIRDSGPGFDPSTLPDPTDPANLERPCGRGLLLMRTFMDDVISNDRGHEVPLIKRHSENGDDDPDDAAD